MKRYQCLLSELSNENNFCCVNLSIGGVGTIGKDSLIITAMENYDLSKDTLNFILNRTINVCSIENLQSNLYKLKQQQQQ